MHIGKPLRTMVFIAGATLLFWSVGHAEQNNHGTIRGYDQGSGKIAIDEGVYYLSSDAKIENLSAGWSGRTALREGVVVRFNADPNGTITEIDILPERRDKLRELEIGPAAE